MIQIYRIKILDKQVAQISKFTGRKLGAFFRAIVDAFSVLASFIVGTFALFVSQSFPGQETKAGAPDFLSIISGLGTEIIAITLLSIMLYWGLGFYGRLRAYRFRHKVARVVQGVIVSYLAFALLLYLFPEKLSVPIIVFAVSLISTLALVTGSRFLFSIMMLVMEERPSSRTGIRDFVKGHETVLVIGGAGYIGSLLLPRLIDKGYRVRLLDLMLFGDKTIASVIKHPNLDIIQGDYRKIDCLVEAIRGTDSVIHLGGIVGDPACSVDEELTVDVNLTSTKTIGEVAKGHGVKRFVFASSCSVYGASDEILDEQSRLNPVSLYARSKIASEKVLLELMDENFNPVFLRFGTIFGLSGRTRFDLVVNLLAAKSIFDGEITVFGPDQWRPFLHVDDAAEAVRVAMEAPLNLASGQAFNVGSNSQNFTLGQVGQMIKNRVPEAKLIVSEQDGDRRNYRVNFDKIHNQLKYSTRWTLEMGIDQVLEAIRSGKITDYKDAQYSNLKSMEQFHEQDLLAARLHDDGWEQRLLHRVS